MDSIDFSIELQRITENLQEQHLKEIEELAKSKLENISPKEDDIMVLRIDTRKMSAFTIKHFVETLKKALPNTIVITLADYSFISPVDCVQLLEKQLEEVKNQGGH